MPQPIARPAHSELLIKKSRFIGCVQPMHDRASAQAVVDALRQTHPGAAHVCWALLAGGQSAAVDDGEPSGTAGRPMLEVLRHHDLEGADVGAIQGRLGARFGQYVGVEGEIGLGVLKDNLSVGGVDGEAKMNYSAAAYAVGFLPVGEKADLYVRGGYGTTKGSVTVPGEFNRVSGESWNYGAGGQYLFDGKNGVRADYTRHDFTDGGGKADVYSVGYVHKF